MGKRYSAPDWDVAGGPVARLELRGRYQRLIVMDGLAQPHRGVRNPVIDLRTYILDPVEKFLEGEIGVKGRLVMTGERHTASSRIESGHDSVGICRRLPPRPLETRV